MPKPVCTVESTVEATAEPEPSEDEATPAEIIPLEDVPYVSPASALQDSFDSIRIGVGREHEFTSADKLCIVIVCNPQGPRFREAAFY